MLDEYQRDEAILHFKRGLVLERAHRVGEAVEEYRQAIARYPHLREAHDALGFYYQRYGLLAKAAEEFRVVANLEDNFLSHFNLGYVLLELERHDEALITFERCLKLIPGDPATHYEVAYLRFLKADYQAALAHLQVALQHYAEDWEIHRLVGRCMLRLGRYDEAHAALTNAHTYALRPAARSEVEELLEALERYREFSAAHSLKDQLYADYGVVQLGSAQDDGLGLTETAEYHFTYPDIAATLRRAVQFISAYSLQCTCVVPLDHLARPVAQALGALLNLPECTAEGLEVGARPLLVLAIGREAELLELARERVPHQQISFCLGSNWLRRSRVIADINGVVVRGACSVPWEPELRRLRSVGAPGEHVQRCLSQATEQILSAMSELAPDETLDRQLAYYARDHRQLRFATR